MSRIQVVCSNLSLVVRVDQGIWFYREQRKRGQIVTKEKEKAKKKKKKNRAKQTTEMCGVGGTSHVLQ